MRGEVMRQIGYWAHLYRSGITRGLLATAACAGAAGAATLQLEAIFTILFWTTLVVCFAAWGHAEENGALWPDDRNSTTSTCRAQLPDYSDWTTLKCRHLSGRLELVSINECSLCLHSGWSFFSMIAHVFSTDGDKIEVVHRGRLLTEDNGLIAANLLREAAQQQTEVTVVTRLTTLSWVPDEPFSIDGKVVQCILRDVGKISDFVIGFSDGSFERRDSTPEYEKLPFARQCRTGLTNLKCRSLSGQLELVNIDGHFLLLQAVQHYSATPTVFHLIAQAFFTDAFEVEVAHQGRLLTAESGLDAANLLREAAEQKTEVTVMARATTLSWVPDGPFSIDGKVVQCILRDVAKISDFVICFSDGSFKRHEFAPEYDSLFGHAHSTTILNCRNLRDRTERVDIYGLRSVFEICRGVANAYELDHEVVLVYQGQLFTADGERDALHLLRKAARQNEEVTVLARSTALSGVPDEPFAIDGKVVQRIFREPGKVSDYVISFTDGSFKRRGFSLQHEKLFGCAPANMRLKCRNLSGRTECVETCGLHSMFEVCNGIAHAFQLDEGFHEVRVVHQGQLLTADSKDEAVSILHEAAMQEAEVTIVVQSACVSWKPDDAGFRLDKKEVECISRDLGERSDYVISFSDGSSKRQVATPQLEQLFASLAAQRRRTYSKASRRFE